MSNKRLGRKGWWSHNEKSLCFRVLSSDRWQLHQVIRLMIGIRRMISPVTHATVRVSNKLGNDSLLVLDLLSSHQSDVSPRRKGRGDGRTRC